jgi:tRNA (guanine-N7-)-methyltransferase
MHTEDVRPARVRREVVSYVRRSARMRPNQRQIWEDHHDRFVIEVARRETSTSVHPEATVDLEQAFGRDAPLVVEIGPGTGESLAAMAAERPDANILAFEVYQPAIAQILGRLVAQGLENVRVIEADAEAGLRHLLAADSIDELWTFFPDPWRKVRHHKRRLLDAEFVDLAASRLRSGALWRLATDWADYAEQMRTVLEAHPAFANTAGTGWAPRLESRPVTRFERRGLEAGRTVVDLCYRRVES